MSRRVAIIADANTHLGPDLARTLAAREHDLVLSEPAEGLVEERRGGRERGGGNRDGGPSRR